MENINSAYSILIKKRIDKKFETLVYKYVKIRNPDLGRNPRFLIHGGGVYWPNMGCDAAESMVLTMASLW